MTTSLSAHLVVEGLEDISKLLEENGIDETIVNDLDDADLRELGLNLGQRKKLLKAIDSYSRLAVAQKNSEAERRQITVAFCDMVGSSRLSTRLDVEAMREVISSYQNACQSVMRGHGGHIAYTQGDGLIAYFGYPVSHEDAAAFAVRAGLAVVDAVSALETPAGPDLAVRVGIATGIVVVGDLIGDASNQRDFVVGETPNLACRLQGIAGPGEVFVTQETRDLAGREFLYEDLGTPEIKGFSQPPRVHRVVEEREFQSRFDARAAETLAPLIGRETEVTQLLSHWQGARQGSGHLCLVSGVAGIGKSRLVREFLDNIADQAPGLIQLQCASHLANRTLHPIVKELSRAAGFLKSDDTESMFSKLREWTGTASGLNADDLPMLADLLGIDTEIASDMDVRTRVQLTHRMILRWIEGQAMAGPLVVSFEDAHWADSSTQEFLGLLIDNLERTSIFLLVTHRPDFEPPWDLQDLPHISSRIDLKPLDVEAGTNLIAQIAGMRHLPRALVGEIINRTDGVPLFLEELTKSVVDQNSRTSQAFNMPQSEAMWLPSTLQASLMGRLDRLESGKKVAQLGAVIGREFSANMIRAVAPSDLDVDKGLQQVLDSELLCRTQEALEQEVFAFNHALVQDAAYESILISSRKAIHNALAGVMLQGHPAFGALEPEVLARHCDLGGLNQEAMENWLAAGRDALRNANNLAAVTYLRSALGQIRMLESTPTLKASELAIQMSLSTASMVIHGWGSVQVEEACMRSRELALELGDTEALFGTVWGLWTNYFLRGELESALDVALEADMMAKASGVSMLLTAADHAVGYTQYFRGELVQALQRAEAGLARMSPEDSFKIIQTFQLSSGVAFGAIKSGALYRMGRQAEADAAFEDRMIFARDLEHPPSHAAALGFAGQEMVVRRDWDRLRVIATECLQISLDEAFILWEKVAAVQLAIVQGLREPSLEKVREIDQASDAFFATQTILTDLMYSPVVAEIEIMAGAPENAMARLAQAITDAKRRKEEINLAEIFRVRGEVHRALGDSDGAKADFEMAAEVAVRQGATLLHDRARESLDDILRSTDRTTYS